MSKIKNLAFQNANWEKVEIEENQQQTTTRKQDWEWINWEKGKVIYGYYIGIRKSKSGKVFGLIMKDLPVEEGEPICYAFSIPVDLRRRLEAVENRGMILHGVMIECIDIVDLGNDRKMYKFDVQVAPDLSISEDVIMQFLSFTPEKLTGGTII